MKEIRIAIIGTGMISHRHMTVIENLQKRGQALKVVAAAEIDKEKLEAFGKQYGIAEEDLYQDFREMLKRDDIDEVEVCVHNNLHTSVATAVMAAGFDCYSEKPMAASYADAKILYVAQKKYGKKLAVQISSIYKSANSYCEENDRRRKTWKNLSCKKCRTSSPRTSWI